MRIFMIRNPSTQFYCSYAFDWAFCVILLILFFLLDRVEPFHREFSVDDKAIMYPIKKETIPIWAAALMMVVFPVLVMFVISIGVRRSIYDFHNGVLGLLLSVLLTTIFTQVIKVTVGKLRPDFLNRCIPMINGAPLTQDRPLQLWTVSVCTQTDHNILKDGFRSFPSGHASTSFAGLFYLSLWLGGKMHVFDLKGYSLKPVLLIMPILAAMLIGISRIQDYRHAGIDVTWGSIIGIIFAWFAYFQYYPSLTSKNSQIPNPCRVFTLPEDTRIEDAGHLESAIGIRRNSGDFIDESRGNQSGYVDRTGEGVRGQGQEQQQFHQQSHQSSQQPFQQQTQAQS